VLINERPGFVGMAARARTLIDARFLGLTLGRVNLMAIGANHPAFRYRVVEVVPKLRDLRAVTLAAIGGLVASHQRLSGNGRGEHLGVEAIQCFALLSFGVSVRAGMDLVACHTGDLGPTMRSLVIQGWGHGVGVAA
jgi:hypothetical protein